MLIPQQIMDKIESHDRATHWEGRSELSTYARTQLDVPLGPIVLEIKDREKPKPRQQPSYLTSRYRALFPR